MFALFVSLAFLARKKDEGRKSKSLGLKAAVSTIVFGVFFLGQEIPIGYKPYFYHSVHLNTSRYLTLLSKPLGISS
jgi:hypothetical protein